VQPVHSTLRPVQGAPLEAAHLSDRQRLAVVLQGTALLAHLQGAGWHLPEGWAGARVNAAGRLGGLVASPGRLGALQELLRDLLARCFGETGVRGRGAARRAARALEEAWALDLAPLPADGAVAQVLAAAPFLWEPAFGEARRALGGERLSDEGPAGAKSLENGHRLWLAGPGPFRRRVLARATDSVTLGALLAGPEARDLWVGPSMAEAPGNLVAAGRFRGAVLAWERNPPRTAAERLTFARALETLGRFERALEALGEDRSLEARVIRARCQLRLGRLGAVRAALYRLEAVAASPEITIELAELATRTFANFGEPEAAARWVERALAATKRSGFSRDSGALAFRAALIAAVSAWDRGEGDVARRHLARAEGLEADPRDAWRGYQARGLVALANGLSREAADHFAAALRSGRRILPRFEAGGLWNDLGLARAEIDDLAGAERAFLHVHRLLAGCDGPRRTTLALYNLAEVRLRRGRLGGVREILEASSTENRLAGNLRGQIHDAELSVRLDLARGRVETALARIDSARLLLRERRADWRTGELSVLAARALGWLGRSDEASLELETAGDHAAGLLEPEEIPALLALAGRRDAALAAATGTPWYPLFAAALGVRHPWGASDDVLEPDPSSLDLLEPARAARLVFDLESIAALDPRRRSDGSEIVSPARRRRAAEILRRQGAGRFAERLEARDASPDANKSALDGSAAARLALLQLRPTPPVPDGEPKGASRSSTVSLPSPTVMRPAGWIGDHPALQKAFEKIVRLAPGDLAVLVLGESGTGKELAAREVHRRSRRHRGPYVSVNCAALSETLLLSDLFGHARGAFTGADRERLGVFETAQGGTVFLDEIGDLPPVAQGMLLRVLQEGEVRRLGESLPRKVDVRVVAATHRDLARASREGTFRQDLYFRLRGASVALPPLRERGGDVLLLATNMIEREAARLKIVPVPRLDREAAKRLAVHSWPGNVRELENVVRVACQLAAGENLITPEHLDIDEPAGGHSAGSYHAQVDELKRRLLREALAAANGKRAAAARLLGLSRQALSYLIRELRIDDW
jgi:transcriptional regulator with AAA-type ATPase domain/tetratricopeptide (TPR) repeat protein